MGLCLGAFYVKNFSGVWFFFYSGGREFIIGIIRYYIEGVMHSPCASEKTINRNKAASILILKKRQGRKKKRNKEKNSTMFEIWIPGADRPVSNVLWKLVRFIFSKEWNSRVRSGILRMRQSKSSVTNRFLSIEFKFYRIKSERFSGGPCTRTPLAHSWKTAIIFS